jgi:hypothetical protein
MWRCTLAVLLLVAAPLKAQDPAIRDTVLLDRSFSDSVETSRIFLLKKTVYELELSRGAARPRFVSVRRGVYPPTALRIRDGGGELGGPIYEVHVDRDGEYEIGLSGLAGGDGIRLQLRADAAGTLYREARLNEPGWSIGLRAELGRHSGYLTGASPESGEGGSAYDGCVLIGYGNKASLCLGGGTDARGGGDTKVTWIFAELHLRIFSLNPGSLRPTGIGAVVRLANGNTGSAVSRDPSFYGIGVYLQQAITPSSRGRGVSVLGSVQYGMVRNITIKGENASLIKLGLQWLP